MNFLSQIKTNLSVIPSLLTCKTLSGKERKVPGQILVSILIMVLIIGLVTVSSTIGIQRNVTQTSGQLQFDETINNNEKALVAIAGISAKNPNASLMCLFGTCLGEIIESELGINSTALANTLPGFRSLSCDDGSSGSGFVQLNCVLEDLEGKRTYIIIKQTSTNNQIEDYSLPAGGTVSARFTIPTAASPGDLVVKYVNDTPRLAFNIICYNAASKVVFRTAPLQDVAALSTLFSNASWNVPAKTVTFKISSLSSTIGCSNASGLPAIFQVENLGTTANTVQVLPSTDSTNFSQGNRVLYTYAYDPTKTEQAAPSQSVSLTLGDRPSGFLNSGLNTTSYSGNYCGNGVIDGRIDFTSNLSSLYGVQTYNVGGAGSGYTVGGTYTYLPPPNPHLAQDFTLNQASNPNTREFCDTGSANGVRQAIPAYPNGSVAQPVTVPLTTAYCGANCNRVTRINGPFCGDGQTNGPEVCDAGVGGNTLMCGGNCNTTCTGYTAACPPPPSGSQCCDISGYDPFTGQVICDGGCGVDPHPPGADYCSFCECDVCNE